MRGRCVTGSMPIISGVGDQRARADAEHRPSAGQVVELHEAVGDHHRVVVGQADDPGAEPDPLRPLPCGGEEHRRVGDVLPRRRVVLADPGLLEAEPVAPLDQLEVVAERDQRALAHRVVRRDEHAEAHRSRLGPSVVRQRLPPPCIAPLWRAGPPAFGSGAPTAPDRHGRGTTCWTAHALPSGSEKNTKLPHGMSWFADTGVATSSTSSHRMLVACRPQPVSWRVCAVDVVKERPLLAPPLGSVWTCRRGVSVRQPAAACASVARAAAMAAWRGVA